MTRRVDAHTIVHALSPLQRQCEHINIADMSGSQHDRLSARGTEEGEGSSFLLSLLKLPADLPLPAPQGPGIERYLLERYAQDTRAWSRIAYYSLKPLIPRWVQLGLRRNYARLQTHTSFPAWPVEPVVVEEARNYLLQVAGSNGGTPTPRIAPWPDGQKFCFVITHDVEWDEGLRNALTLATMERELGFVSSWNIVPERYPIDWAIVRELESLGCEIGVHGLRHDGKDFLSRRVFERRAQAINRYAREWGAVGFRSPATMRNAAWLKALSIEYDTSFPDTDPYEPQPGGCCSIWPYFIGDIVELPITMPQDHTLFEILGHTDIRVWTEKADWIATSSGMVLIDVHPDYMLSADRLRLYRELLLHMKKKSAMWHALPRDVARWWRERDATTVRCGSGQIVVDGPAANRVSLLATSVEKGVLVERALNIAEADQPQVQSHGRGTLAV